MPTAAERAGDRGEVHRLGPHRHRPVPRFDLLEHRGHLGLLGGAHDVDDALDFLGPRVGPFLVSDNGIHEAAAFGGVGQQLRGPQHPRQHRQPGERMGVEQRAADRGVVDAQLHQPGGQPVRTRAGPAERTGVGGQPGVEAVRDADVDRLAPCVEQLGDQHRGGVRGRVDEVGAAEQLVGGVVVDHQHLAAGFGELTQRAEPVDAGNVDGDHQVGVAAHVVGRDQQVTARQRLKRFGQAGRCGEADLDVLARMVQHQRKSQAGTDGVGVGIDVADHADGAAAASAARRRRGRRRADPPGLSRSSDQSRSTVSSASCLSSSSPPEFPR